MELFRLLGTIAVDNSGANVAIDDTTDKASKAEGKLSKFFSKVGSYAVNAGKVMATGVAVGSAAITALSKAALDGYADYEQLVGGVETLFGAGGQSLKEYAATVGKTTDEVSDKYYSLLKAQGTVLQNAKKAYKTAGMSANEYMETVTSVSASLIQSLNGDTEAAAQKADKAISDMSDNANKMGSSMESIQNAYQGFAKQNYTMLDNLKLGYGGTKEEMARLLEDATKLSGVKYDLSSYADIVDAIHVIQDEMGITGTTAKEASSTISGSVASMKSAWKNLVAGFGDETANINILINDFVDSASIAIENILPRIEKILGGIGKTITKVTPVIVKKLPSIFESLLPGVISGATSLISGLINALPTILKILIEQIPSIFTQIGAACVDVFPVLFATVQDLTGQIVEFIAEKLFGISIDSQSAFAEIGNLFSGLWELCLSIWESAGKPLFDAVSSIFANFKFDGESAFGFIQTVFQTLWMVLSEIWLSVGQPIFGAVISGLQYVADNWESISGTCTTAFQILWDVCGAIWSTIGQPIWDMISFALGSCSELFAEHMPAIMAFFQTAVAGIKDTWENHLKPVFEAIGVFLNTVVKPAFEFVWKTRIEPLVTNVFETIKRLWEGTLKPVFDGICDFLLGVFTLDWKRALQGILNIVTGIFNAIMIAVEKPMNLVKDIVNKTIDFIKEKFNFKWEFPKLKLPHFKISGSFSLNPPSAPSFGIDWYAKAMDNPMIMNSPTAFGINSLGQIMAGGEKGSEVVSGTDTLMNMISGAVESKNNALIIVLEKILAAILLMDENMGGNLREALEGMKFEANMREFARLVKAVN